jgi:NADPH:quinone reductase-like Zn-dependent oxidoreductase
MTMMAWCKVAPRGGGLRFALKARTAHDAIAHSRHMNSYQKQSTSSQYTREVLQRRASTLTMATMKAWQFTSATGGLDKNLYQPASGAPKPRPYDDQILVEVHSMALNPADYKVPELGMIARPLISMPAIPGMDFSGRVAELGSKVDWARVGEMVYGTYTGSLGKGTLAQYVAVGREMVIGTPEGVDVDDAATIGVAGLTAYQAVKPYVEEGKGNKVFVNGGSGGTGVWTIQIAKALGCHVTASCSTANIDLCKSLGADEVLDYKKEDIVEQLKASGEVFHLIVDNIGTPANLYKASDAFLVPGGTFAQVGAGVGFAPAVQIATSAFLPNFLGGGKNKYQMVICKTRFEELGQLGKWMKEGKVKAVIDEKFAWEDAPMAFEKLKLGRTKGKIVVKVKSI